MITNTEAFFCGLAVGFLLTSAIVIIDGARHYRPPIQRQATWTPPAIPVCDEPLYERITEFCNGP